jgi:hypothetical protein
MLDVKTDIVDSRRAVAGKLFMNAANAYRTRSW